jgi:D-threonate/D-erythronate kinase
MKKLLVIADDFSGACEIAGIISRYGRNAEIQLVPDLESRADALVIDLDTRQPDAVLMEDRMAAFTALLRNHPEKFTVFKKVDSVFRGHILKETAFLLEPLAVRRVFLLPANPETGRNIIRGICYVNGEKLHTTVFRSDPHFPATSSRIDAVIDYEDIPLHHIHLSRNTRIPDTGLLTADISSMEDLEYYTAHADDTTLFCGGAQCFDAFVRTVLQWKYVAGKHIPSFPEYRFFINGSAVRTDNERRLLTSGTVACSPVPGYIIGGSYQYDTELFDKWIEVLAGAYEPPTGLYFCIDQPVTTERHISDALLRQLVHLAGRVRELCKGKKIHLLLTGGATASAILNDFGETALQVAAEHAQGVVTVVSGNDDSCFFTVKPGSYPWPESLFNQAEST